MFGQNKISKVENHNNNTLDVQEIFSTIQGEGPFAGQPSIFIRLSGCNLACSFCDTNFEDFNNFTIEEIISRVLELSLNRLGIKVIKLIVITGGEPLRQPIESLCSVLLDNGFKVQIETNGTLYRDLPKEVDIVCSPKATNFKYFLLREDLLEKITAFKFLISKTLIPYNSVPELGQSKFNTPVYIQPMDEYNELSNQHNIEHTLELSMKYGYILSMQIHKILNIA